MASRSPVGPRESIILTAMSEKSRWDLIDHTRVERRKIDGAAVIGLHVPEAPAQDVGKFVG